ncbi:MAG: 30S ribosomal protein S12 methylthiotransferase RimO [Eubacteriales bacterium]|jgi:ribosomal protein S12 methylthiotransferase
MSGLSKPDSVRGKILFISLGCDKNLVDSEHMLGRLADKNYEMTDNEEEADIIIVNTCCFIESAKEESINTVLDMARYKTEGRCRVLIVAGCMAERYRQEVLDEIPEVDAIIGTASLSHIEEAIEKAEKGERGIFLDPLNADSQGTGDSASSNSVASWEDSADSSRPAKRIMTTSGFYEYLKIADGCDKHCTYCAIPSMRGHYRSVPMETLVQEARDLADAGVRELILVAQETTIYGTDLYGRKSLHILLKKLCQIDGLTWIRILYCYPEEIYPELIQTIKEEPKICHYLDMPVQHADDRVLRRMGRHTTRADLERIITDLRKEIPDIVLRTTLITGFPGETEEEHENVVDFVRKMRFDRLGVFTYSQEEGTPAAAMDGQIDEEVKLDYRDELMTVQQQISTERGAALVGKTLKVFIEGYMSADDVYVGRTYADAPDIDGLIFVESDEELNTGDLVDVQVTGSSEYDLTGGYVKNESAE